MVLVAVFILEKIKSGLSKGKLRENLIIVDGTNVGRVLTAKKSPKVSQVSEQTQTQIA